MVNKRKDKNISSQKFTKDQAFVVILGILVAVAGCIGVVDYLSPVMHFESNSLIFSAIGDPHYGYDVEQFADEIIKAWNSDTNLPPIEFGINIGDFTHFGTPEGYKVAMESSFNNFLLPWMFVFGNHDTANFKTGTGRDIYGSRWGLHDRALYDIPSEAIDSGMNTTGVMGQNYAYLWDNILFLIFGDQGTTMLLTYEQRQWLTFMTNQYSNKTTILVSHQGHISEGAGDCYRYYNDIAWWQSFIAENPQIKLHIHGHNHKFKHYQIHGLDVIDVGLTNGMGKPWTVYFQITGDSISAGIYDVIAQRWVQPNLFRKEIATSFLDEGIKWYSVSKRVQDSQVILKYNRILAKEYKLQLIGSDAELIQQNRDFEFWGIRGAAKLIYSPEDALNWIGYEDDYNNGETSGYITFTGQDVFATSTKPAMGNQFFLGWYTKWEEGKVPDSTTPIAVPDKEYTIFIRAKADQPTEDALDVGVLVLGKNLSRIILPYTPVIENISLTEDYQWYNGTFKVPDDPSTWIIKTIWTSKNPGVTCYMNNWSMTRASAISITNNFTVYLNGHKYAHTGILALNECAEFTIDPLTIQQQLEFRPLINGSKTGFIRLVYQDPLLWSDDVSIGIKSVSSDRYECDFRVISHAAPEDKVSLTPFGKNIIAIDKGVPVSCKGNYTAWVFNKLDFPGTYNVTITEE